MHALFLACFGIVVVQAATYISEGWYTIRNAAAGTVLDLYNSVTDRGTTIQGYQALGGINQLWRITRTAAGTYRILTAADGVTSVGYVSDSQGSAVVASQDEVEWTITNVESLAPNTFYFYMGTDYVMDLSEGSSNDATPVILWPKNSNQSIPNQQWILESFQPPLSSGTYSVTNLATGNAFDGYQGVTGAGTPVVENTPSQDASQQWTFDLQTDGTYHIASSGGAYLDFSADAESASLVLSSTAKPWIVIPSPINPNAYFIEDSSGYFVDLPAGIPTPGTRIILFSRNWGTNQQWLVRGPIGQDPSPSP